jgi:hypothetical protein
MTDIVERLRKPMAWAMVWGGTVTADDAPFSAAAEIERWKTLYDTEINRVLALEAEIERLRAALKQRDEDHATITHDLCREIERQSQKEPR